MDVEELLDEVEAGGIVPVTLQELREMLGYKKLGSRVLQEISYSLRGKGLGYFPKEVIDGSEAPRQTDVVRVFAMDSAVGKVVTAVLEPSEANDEYLLDVANGSGSGAAETLQKIRALMGA